MKQQDKQKNKNKKNKNKQKNKQTNKQTNKQASKQASKQTKHKPINQPNHLSSALFETEAYGYRGCRVDPTPFPQGLDALAPLATVPWYDDFFAISRD